MWYGGGDREWYGVVCMEMANGFDSLGTYLFSSWRQMARNINLFTYLLT